MEILLASNNPHKREEFARLFSGHTILLPGEAGMDFDFEENGASFLENALGKAMALYGKAGAPVLSDDSGLCVPALGGEPGLFSSRYGSLDGVSLETRRRNAYLLSRMKGVADRRAYFVCCLVLVMGKDRFFVAQETVHGTISDVPRGENGFGYDPLFILPGVGKTIAELPDKEKDGISHRGRSSRRILDMLKGDA
jgi:XTP/dITP diphosphohydrolase